MTTKDKGKGKAKVESVDGTTVSRARKPKGKIYALPTPSVHHRHRAVPLYSREGRTERLTVRPSLFEPPSLTLTTSFTERPTVLERVNKAWGFNVGHGPLWDLAEDRGWYKEAITTGNNTETEAKHRPRIYPDIPVQDGWEIMSLEYVPFSFSKFLGIFLKFLRAASPYLPTDDVTTEEGNLKPPPPVPCFFGPFKSQIRQDVEMFEAFPMCLCAAYMILFIMLTD
jgi:transcription factor C subunit 6